LYLYQKPGTYRANVGKRGVVEREEISRMVVCHSPGWFIAGVLAIIYQLGSLVKKNIKYVSPPIVICPNGHDAQVVCAIGGYPRTSYGFEIISHFNALIAQIIDAKELAQPSSLL
jgi:hypothetical protein